MRIFSATFFVIFVKLEKAIDFSENDIFWLEMPLTIPKKRMLSSQCLCWLDIFVSCVKNLLLDIIAQGRKYE